MSEECQTNHLPIENVTDDRGIGSSSICPMCGQRATRTRAKPIEALEVPATMAELVDAYINSRQRAAATMQTYRSLARVHLTQSALGERSAESLRIREVRQWYEQRSLRGATYSATGAVILCRAAFNWAVDSGRLPDEARNPFVRVKVRHPPVRSRFLNAEELKRLWLSSSSLEAYWPAFFKVLVLTGLRVGALRQLRWDDIDLRNDCILANVAKTHDPQMIPFGPELRALLQSLPHDQRWLFPRPESPHRAVSQGAVRWRWTIARQGAGLCDVRLHDLRRTAATWMACSGVPLSHIAALLNHRAWRTTTRYVCHDTVGLRAASMHYQSILTRAAIADQSDLGRPTPAQTHPSR